MQLRYCVQSVSSVDDGSSAGESRDHRLEYWQLRFLHDASVLSAE